MADNRTSTPAGDTAGPSSPPPQLPEGWLAQWEGKSRSWYYVSRTTGHSQWEVPTQPIALTPSVTPQPGTGYTHALPNDGSRGMAGAEGTDRSLQGKLLGMAVNSLASGHGSSNHSSYGNSHSSSSSGLGSLASGVMQMAGKLSSSSKPSANQYGQQNAYGQQQTGAYGNNAHGGQQSGNLLSTLGSNFFGKHSGQQNHQQQQQQAGANPFGYGATGQTQAGPYTGNVPQYNNGSFTQPMQHDQHTNNFQQPGMAQAGTYGMTQGFGADAQGGLSTHFQAPASNFPMQSQPQHGNPYAQQSVQNTNNLYDPANPAGAMGAPPPPQPEWHTKPRPNLQTPPSAGGYAGGYGTPTNYSQHMPSQLGVPTPPVQQQTTYSVPPPPPAPTAPPNQQPPPPGIQHHQQQQQYQAYSPQPNMTPSFPPPPQQHPTNSPGPSAGPYPGSGQFVPSQATPSNDAGFYNQGHSSAHGTPSSAMPGFAIPPPPPSTGQTPQHSSYGGGQQQGYGNMASAYGQPQQPHQQSQPHPGNAGASPYGHGVGGGGYY